MSTHDKAPAAETAQDLADKHDLRLHRAKQRCQQVGYKGRNRYIDALHLHKGDAEMTIYLDHGELARPSELTILEQPI